MASAYPWCDEWELAHAFLSSARSALTNQTPHSSKAAASMLPSMGTAPLASTTPNRLGSGLSRRGCTRKAEIANAKLRSGRAMRYPG